MNNNKGFTLIELLVVVLIIGILAAMAMPQYFKAVERSRMTEAVTLLSNVAQAQQRKYLQVNRFAQSFKGLDVAPKGASGPTFYTKGDVSTGTGGNGFVITLDTTNAANYNGAIVNATRHSGAGTLQYKYQLQRYYAGNGTACKGDGTDGPAKNGAELCADFCGLDSLADNTWCCSDGGTTVNSTFSALAGACSQPADNS